MQNDDKTRCKVLLVSPLPPPASGIGSWTASVVQEAASRRDLEVQVVDTAVRWRSAVNMSPIIRVCGGSAQAMRDVCRVFAAISRCKPDVLHLNTSASLATLKDILILRLARRFGISSVIHYHMGRLPEIIRKNGHEWKLIRTAVGLADRVVVLTKESEHALKDAVPGVNVLTMPNPVNIRAIEALAGGRSRASAAGPVRIAFSGHVTEEKGAGNLVRACARIASDGFVVDIVGLVENGYREELEAIAKERDGGRWLLFYGEMSHADAVRRLSSADILALPSLTEGFPYVVVEAMACGVPVVGTRVGAIPEMLAQDGDEPCGICVAPGDIDALAAALSVLKNDAERRLRMGESGRRRVEDYSLPVVFEQLSVLWRSVERGWR